MSFEKPEIFEKPIIDVVIPAYNEEKSIRFVLDDIPREWVRNIIVANNNSRDRTAEVAIEHGAVVVFQPLQGYGAACLKGLEYIENQAIKPDIVIFIDADYSDHPEQLPELVGAIMAGKSDMVIGSRALGEREKGSMLPQQVFGNWLATTLIRWLYGYHFTDLGPFRAIRYDALKAINMQDTNFGWTVEMQIKAAKLRLRCSEIPAHYRQRIGVSKIAGTIKGTIMAGYKIIYTIFKYR